MLDGFIILKMVQLVSSIGVKNVIFTAIIINV